MGYMKCKRCGACCLEEGWFFPPEKDDLKRWIAQNRLDILKHIRIRLNDEKRIRGDELKEEQIEFSEPFLWFSPGGRRLNRCPFLRKERNKTKYRCLINETKPDRCRKYEPWWNSNELIKLLGYQCCKNIKTTYLPEFEVKLDKKLLNRLKRIQNKRDMKPPLNIK